MEDKKDYVNEFIWMMVGIAAIFLIACITYSAFENYQREHTEYVTVTDVLVSKQSEQESINNFGDFRTNYYLLYESGELEKVELEEYMSFKEGDTIERYEIKDE